MLIKEDTEVKNVIHFNCTFDWTSTEYVSVGCFGSVTHNSHQCQIGCSHHGAILKGVNS